MMNIFRAWEVKPWLGATLAQARIVTSMSIQGPVSLYIIHGHHIGQKEIRYIFFYSCSKGDTCQFRHEPAALTNETVSARSWRVKRWKEQSSKKCLASWGSHDHERRARDKERERRGKEWGERWKRWMRGEEGGSERGEVERKRERQRPTERHTCL